MMRAAWLFGLLMSCWASQAVAEDCSRRGGASATQPLTVRYMGVSTILLDDGATQVLFDGFFSRPGLLQSFVGWIGPDNDAIGDGLRRGDVEDRLKAVFVAHAHHDHALDAPEIARRSGAALYGSRSVATYSKGKVADRQMCRLEGPQIVRIGDFELEVVPSPHSKPELFPWPARGHFGSRFWAPRLGSGRENFAFLVTHHGVRLLIHPSADVTPGLYRCRRADLVFLGIGGLGRASDTSRRRYFHELLDLTGAGVAIPIHWDNFGRKIADRLEPLPAPLDHVDKTRATLTAFAAEGTIKLEDPKPFEPWAATANDFNLRRPLMDCDVR
jgi:L-ascorbate metabolism protein UlaG (beta-lactamase superfamily)